MPPLAKICSIYIAGILLAWATNPPVDWLILFDGLIFCLLIFAAIIPRLQRQADLFLMLLLVGTAATWRQVNITVLPHNHIGYFAERNERLQLTGVISQSPEIRPDNIRFLIQADTLWLDKKAFAVTGVVRVTFSATETALKPGDRIQASGRLYIPSTTRNPGAFDYRRLMQIKQIDASFSVKHADDLAITGYQSPPFLDRYFILPAREHALHVIDQTVSGPPAALAKGVLLGIRGGIPAEVIEEFSNTGVIHILAVSGLNVVLLAEIFLFAMRLLRIIRMPLNETALAVGVIFFVTCYSLLCLSDPPVVRASVMVGIYYLAKALQRTPNTYNSLAAAALFILLFAPDDLFYVGFQMSFVATWALIYFTARFQAWLPERWFPKEPASRWEWLRKETLILFLASFAAQIGTIPVTVYYFNRLPLISLLANLLVVPLVNISLALSFFAVTIGYAEAFMHLILDGLGHLLNPIHAGLMAANWALLEFVLWLVKQIARIPYGLVVLPTPDAISISLFMLLLIFSARVRTSIPARKWAIFVLLIWLNTLIWSKVWRVFHPQMVVTFLDVGQGDAAFVECPNGRTILIDGGDAEDDFSYGERVIAPFLRTKGLSRVDCVIVSHPHDDHLGGLNYILERFEVGLVLDSGQVYASQRYRRFLELIGEKKIPYAIGRAGDRLTGCEPAQVEILHPSAEYAAKNFDAASFNPNDGSLVLKLSYGEVDCLFTGDAEAEAEAFFAGEKLACEIVKAPHHGSKTSSTPDFVRQTRPQVVYISCGNRNKFKHPAAEVLRRYHSVYSRIYRSDQNGALVIKTDGIQFDAQPMVTDY